MRIASILPAFFAALPLFAGQQVIDVGQTPNDGTGDSLRAAWVKANANFTELYSRTNAPTQTNLWRTVGEFGPVGTTNDTATFQAALDSGGLIAVPPGTYSVGELALRNNTVFRGFAATLALLPEVNSGWLLSMPTNAANIEIEGFTLDGGGSKLACPNGSPAGSRGGLLVNPDGQGCSVSHMNFTGFTGWGLRTLGTTNIVSTYQLPKIFLSHCQARNCSIGFLFDSPDANHVSEYFLINAIDAYENTIGIFINSANIHISSSMSDANVIGVWLGNGYNAGHGTWSGGSINHNSCAVYAMACFTGFIFNGAYINGNGSTSYADFQFLYSQRVLVENCQLVITSIQTLGGTNYIPSWFRNNQYWGYWSNIVKTIQSPVAFEGNVSMDHLGDSDGTRILATNDPGTNVDLSTYILSK